MALDLESLGMTQEELQDRVVERIVDSVCSRWVSDDNDGGFAGSSEFRRKIDEAVEAKVRTVIAAACDNAIEPIVTEGVKAIVMQRTNHWGEAKGEPVTFREYLVEFAQKYFKEDVDKHGRSYEENRQHGCSFTKSTTRLVYQVSRLIDDAIEDAMKTIIEGANATFAEGLQKTAKAKLLEIANAIQITVKTK